MLAILGSAVTAEPWILAQHWAAEEVGVLTPADLSKPGWRLRPAGAGQNAIVLNGESLPLAAVTGVVTTMPAVGVHDLPHIVEPDREYVAAEMTAFLLAWLSYLHCPVIERPTPTSLDGCGRRLWQWIALARVLGIAAPAPGSADDRDAVEVTVVDGRAVDPPSRAFGLAAEQLATAASRTLVTLCFLRARRPTLLGVKHVPAVDSPAVADALLAWFDR